MPLSERAVALMKELGSGHLTVTDNNHPAVEELHRNGLIQTYRKDGMLTAYLTDAGKSALVKIENQEKEISAAKAAEANREAVEKKRYIVNTCISVLALIVAAISALISLLTLLKK